ncbi:MAG: hypothetical protein V7761_06875, partial [Amylibacter sp.]
MLGFGILTIILLTSMLLVGLLLKNRPVEYAVSPAIPKKPNPVDTKPKNSSDQFMQTMSATFAHLQIGIAAFDAH